MFRVVSREVSADRPDLYNAYYVEAEGVRLRSGARVSEDNGRTWRTEPMTPGLRAGLPYGYRRDLLTSLLEPHTGRLVGAVGALDVAGLDPRVSEPSVRIKEAYLRYAVSTDGAKTWRVEEPMVQSGSFTQRHPFPGIWLGTNSLFQGDIGCVPISTRSGKILVPCQFTPVGEDGRTRNPLRTYTYHQPLVLIGTWSADAHLSWKASQNVPDDPKRSSRGYFEPTLAEFPDGRILMVMRGSNADKADPEFKRPSYKWFVVSRDGGETWSQVEPWTYEDGQSFYSPSSMSRLFRLSNGRVFWVGNLISKNAQGNSPRWPMVVGEVSPQTLKLNRASVLLVDTQLEQDKNQGRLDICHFSVLEDRQTKGIVLVYPRAHNEYKWREYATVRLTVR